MEKYYTVKEVMALLNYSERSIRQFIFDGRIKSIRTVTGGIRIPEEEVKKFIERK